MQRIINTSRDNQQMHIIPPTTPFFTIKYSKQVYHNTLTCWQLSMPTVKLHTHALKCCCLWSGDELWPSHLQFSILQAMRNCMGSLVLLLE